MLFVLVYVIDYKHSEITSYTSQFSFKPSSSILFYFVVLLSILCTGIVY